MYMENPVKQAGLGSSFMKGINKIFGATSKAVPKAVDDAADAASGTIKFPAGGAGATADAAAGAAEAAAPAASKGILKRNPIKTAIGATAVGGTAAAGTGYAYGNASGQQTGAQKTTETMASHMNGMGFLDWIKMLFRGLFGNKFTGQGLYNLGRGLNEDGSTKSSSYAGRDFTNFERFQAVVVKHRPDVEVDEVIKSASVHVEEIPGLREMLAQVSAEEVKQAMMEFKDAKGANESGRRPSSLQRIVAAL